MTPAPSEQPLVWPDARRVTARRQPSAFTLLLDRATPARLEALLTLAAMTDPLAREAAGALPLIPADRRYAGPNAHVVMLPFLLRRPSRFCDGSFGVLYVADIIETALNEAGYHHARRLVAATAPAGTTLTLSSFAIDFAARLIDIRRVHGRCPDPDIYHPDQYVRSVVFARATRTQGHEGIHYDSVRRPLGECGALFYPDVVRDVQVREDWIAVYDGRERFEFAQSRAT